MPVSLPRFTVDEVEAFPADGNRYELLSGVLLVTPGPGILHQTVAARLVGLLAQFLQPEPKAMVWSPGVIRLRPDTQLEPDILVGLLPPRLTHWEEVPEYWLAVEVSGTGSRVYDRDYKEGAYLEIGVPEVWRVDLDARTVTMARPGGERRELRQGEWSWRSPGSGRELNLDLTTLFRNA